MSCTFTALLCLGLTLSLWIPVLTGSLPKPILRVQPDSVVSRRTKVTFFCEETIGANEYHLYKDGKLYKTVTKNKQKPANKAEFSFSNVDLRNAGQYRCSYSTQDESSGYSDLLELVVTGIYEYYEPRLSVLPSPVVTAGGNMTLHCASDFHYDKFILTKEDKKFTSSLDTEHISSSRQYRALFIIGPTTPTHTGTFRCYGYYKNAPQLWSVPSALQQILISGLSKKPSLLTHQGHTMDPGMTLTLQCFSDINYDRYALHKVGGADIMQHSSQQTDTGFSVANFTLGYVSSSTGGQYRCYGAHNLSSEWSASSEPLDILITGQLPLTPSLSVKPNHTVHSGETVSLLCWSMDPVDTFILSKEGSAQQPLRLKSKSHDQQSQAEFSMSAVTSHLSGTYRCYGAQDSSFYLLSSASAPVELTVSETIESSTWSPKRPIPPIPTENKDHTMENLIRMGMAVLVLIVLSILATEAWRSHRQTHPAAGN
eukprot:XP_017177527.1 PREDICTED: paired-Ig-like receptor A1 isoform X4 [Mus musculus]